MGRRERQRELARTRARKLKIQKLRAKFAASKNEGEKAEIREKFRRLSPFATLEG